MPNLDQNEADVEANIDFQNVFNATSASFTVNQTNPGVGPVTVKISAFSTAAEPGVNFVDGLTNDTHVNITSASIVDFVVKTGNTQFTPVATVNADGTLTITGLSTGDEVQWTTSGTHDRVLIENISNADGISGNDNNTFDIGGFSLIQAQPAPDEKLDFTVQIADADGDTASATPSPSGSTDRDSTTTTTASSRLSRKLAGCAPFGAQPAASHRTSSGRGWMKVKEPDFAAVMSLVWRQAPALLVFSFLANLLLVSAVYRLQVCDACPAERSARHAVVADTRGARRHPPSFLAARRFETIRAFDLREVNVPSPPNPSQSSRPVELSSALRACRGAFVGIGLISAVLNVLYLTGSFFMLAVYDRVLPSRSLPTLVALALLAFGLYLFQAVLDVLRGRVLVRIGSAAR